MKSWLVNGKFQPQWFVSVSDLTGPSCQLGKDTLECLSLDSSFRPIITYQDGGLGEESEKRIHFPNGK